MKQPSVPRPISIAGVPESPWTQSKENILSQSSIHNYIANMHETQLQQLTIAISSPSKCPHPELTSHFVRISSQLLRTLVCGTGTPDLQWANPSTPLPLRIYAFSSFLILCREVTLYQNKNGVTKLSGKGKMDMKSMGKMVSLLFDDELLFGDQKEIFPDDPTIKEEEKLLDDILGFDPASLDLSTISALDMAHSAGAKKYDKQSRSSRDKAKKEIEAFSVLANPGNDPLNTFEGATINPAITKNRSDEGTSNENPATHDTNGNATAVTTDANVNFAQWLSQDAEYCDVDLNLSTGVNSKAKYDPCATSTQAVNGGSIKSNEQEVTKKTPSASSSMDDMNNSFSSWLSQDCETDDCLSPTNSSQKEVKVDSQFDFRNALNSATSNDDGFRMTNTSKTSKNSFDMSNFTGSSNTLSGRRKYMTLPTLGLATIEEDREAKKSDNDPAILATDRTSGIIDRKYGNTLSTESLKAAAKSHRGAKQFRIPKLKKDTEQEQEKDEGLSFLFSGSDSLVKVPEKRDKIPKTDKEIEASGTAFLDVIEKNLGLG